jgi:hypothetical protein
MYAQEMPRLKAAGLASPEGLASLVTFAILSIHVQFPSVPHALADVREHGTDSRYLFGNKRAAVRWLEINKRQLWREVTRISQLEPGESRAVAMVYALSMVPDLGMVKAGFVAAMLGENTACLDVHNLQWLGLKNSAVKLSKRAKPATIARRILAYVRRGIEAGGAAVFWDRWCVAMAAQYHRTPEEISRVHLAALQGVTI